MSARLSTTCACIPVKQPPTRTTPRFPQNTDLQSLHNHDGAVTSFMSAKMPVPITTPTFTTTPITAPTKHPQAATATITNKSSQASLQLTHELRGYIRQMRSHAPTGNEENTTHIDITWLSLSATP
jgi:hypothetical protein